MAGLNGNPEFRRNLWLELTPQRLIAMPLVLALFFYLVHRFDTPNSTGLAFGAGVLFYLLVLLWGCRLAAAGIGTEIREGTWDWQRMSSLGPWSMAWAKLLGSTAFVWYGGVMCLAALAFALSARYDFATIALVVLAMTTCGLLGQATGLAACLAWLRKTRPTRRLPVTLCQLIGAGVGYGLSHTAVPILQVEAVHQRYATVTWYDFQVDTRAFVLISLLLFFGWALLAVYRLMRAELQLKTRPWAWVAFTLFLIVYLEGLMLGRCENCGDSILAVLLPAFVIAVLSTYLIVFLEPKDVVQLRGLLTAARTGRWGRAATHAPAWLPATILVVIFAVVIAVLTANLPPVSDQLAAAWPDFAGQAWRGRAFETVPFTNETIGAWSLAVLLFLWRDLALILGLNLSQRRRRADLAALVYLVVLYGLLPGLFEAINLPWARAFLVPGSLSDPWLNVATALAQAALGSAWVLMRWRDLKAQMAAPHPTVTAANLQSGEPSPRQEASSAGST